MNLQRSSCRIDSEISSSCLKVGMRPGVSVRCNARRWSRCASAAWFASLANSLRHLPRGKRPEGLCNLFLHESLISCQRQLPFSLHFIKRHPSANGLTRLMLVPRCIRRICIHLSHSFAMFHLQSIKSDQAQLASTASAKSTHVAKDGDKPEGTVGYSISSYKSIRSATNSTLKCKQCVSQTCLKYT